MPAAGVLWRVSLRQAAPAIGLAAVWVALQTVGEITVTDLGMVRTFEQERWGSHNARGCSNPGEPMRYFSAAGQAMRKSHIEHAA